MHGNSTRILPRLGAEIDKSSTIDQAVESEAFLNIVKSPLAELSTSVNKLNQQLLALSQINKSLVTFNVNFGMLVQGMKLNSECTTFPEEPRSSSYSLAARPRTPSPPPTSQLPEPQIQHDIDSPVRDFQQQHGDLGGLEHRSAIRKQGPRASNSRNGKDSVVRKKVVVKRKPAFNPKRITDILPARYRGQPHRGIIELILKELHANPDGMYMYELMKEVQGDLTRSKCTEYLNMLVREEHLIRVSKKGHLFLFNKEKHPN